jgi:Holliday junction resolvase RusA-like endonuclease
VFRRGAVFGSEPCEVALVIYLGKGGRGDADNFGKVCLDSLVDCGVIESDAAVKRLKIEKFRDPANPRTEFTIKSLSS